MRFSLPALVALALVACSPQIPESNPTEPGVGFGNYQQYQQERVLREAQLQGRGAPAVRTTAAPQVQTAATAQPVRTATAQPVRTATARPQATATTRPATAVVSNPGISDEQDFAAVAERESIESDKQRLAQQRAQYQVVQPTTAPKRTGGEEPNIVAYALKTNNVVGQKLYRRFGFYSKAKYDENCSKYFSPDRAQEDFLRSGGPGRDRFGLDPDGDGFACGWNPATFRKAARGG